jgi:HNH endonuclease
MAAGELSTKDLVAFRAQLGVMAPAVDDAERIDRIRALEELKAAVAAAQAVETSAFADSQRTAQLHAGEPASRIGRGIAGQVALARRESPYRAQRYVGWSAILTRELPETFATLQSGATSEWRALLVARETAWLSRQDRAEVDRRIGPSLPRLGDRQVEAETKRLTYRIDPHGYVGRLAAAESERRVALRPAPDAMARLSALLPVAQGVAAYAALTRAADTARSSGTESRGRGQMMADLLVERLTGQATADAVPVEVSLVMTDAALFGAAQAGGHDEPAELLGYGPLPAAWARRLVTRLPEQSPAWIRRLYRRPGSGELVAMESRRRAFTAGQRRFVEIRDHAVCRTPWCGAPVRHIDHVLPAERGGPTDIANAQGLCEACNYAKQAPGWVARVADPRTGSVVLTTPTGHDYPHDPPTPPGRCRGHGTIEFSWHVAA